MSTGQKFITSRLSVADLDELVEMQKQIYPLLLQETRATLDHLLQNNVYNFGIRMDSALIGFILGESEGDTRVWLYDIAVLQEWQRKGLSIQLLKAFFEVTSRDGSTVHVTCRDTSYPIFSNPEKMGSFGYSIVQDIFEKDGYFQRCGIHEDSHALLLAPIH